MRIIPFKGFPLGEVRKSYFLEVFNREVEFVRIVAFGRCNFRCPYCLRGGQYIDKNKLIKTSDEYPDELIFKLLESALLEGQRIRLSGGDPCMYIEDCLRIAKWSCEQGKKISFCHNGSSPFFVEKIAPYTEYAAIDIKAGNIDEFSIRTGVPKRMAKKMLQNSLNCQQILLEKDIILDVRTCIFSTTTLEELDNIAYMILDNNYDHTKFLWTIRKYSQINGLDWLPMNNTKAKEMIQCISQKYPKLLIAYREKWLRGGLEYWKSGKALSFNKIKSEKEE